MAIKEAGVWPCTITSATFGDDYRGVPAVQINGRIDDGPSKGMMFTYEETVDAKQAPYTARSCKAVGWKGRSLLDLHDDCAAWIAATGGKSTVQIDHVPIKKGKKYDKWIADGCVDPPPVWDKAKAIGVGAKALTKPSQQSVADADEAMRMAMGEAPPDDSAPSNTDEIPF